MDSHVFSCFNEMWKIIDWIRDEKIVYFSRISIILWEEKRKNKANFRLRNENNEKTIRVRFCRCMIYDNRFLNEDYVDNWLTSMYHQYRNLHNLNREINMKRRIFSVVSTYKYYKFEGIELDMEYQQIRSLVRNTHRRQGKLRRYHHRYREHW